jgi:hypothetical protein
VALAAVLLCAVQYPVNRDSLHRFLSVAATIAIVIGWLLEDRLHDMLHAAVLVEAAGIGLLFAYRRVPAMLRPMAYAFVVALPGTMLLSMSTWNLETTWWRSSIVLTVWLVWLIRWCAHEHAQRWTEPLTLAVLAALALGVVSTPGLLAAIGLMVLGYALDDRIVLGLGTLFVPVFIIVFYYDLALDLGVKSYMLMGTGAVLLVARWLLSRRSWTQEEAG